MAIKRVAMHRDVTNPDIDVQKRCYRTANIILQDGDTVSLRKQSAETELIIPSG